MQLDTVKQLRDLTNSKASISQCKEALENANSNFHKAVDLLLEQGFTIFTNWRNSSKKVELKVPYKCAEEFHFWNFVNSIDGQRVYATELCTKEYIHVTKDYKNELAVLENTPWSEIILYDLKQDSFEYFVQHYGHKFSIIHLRHSRLINDFSCLSILDKLEYMIIEWNIRATQLWDMSGNLALKGIKLWDTKKITNFHELTTAPTLKELAIDESVDSQLGSSPWKLETLKPLSQLKNLEKLNLTVSKVQDSDITPLLDLKKISKLSIIANLFSLEEFALLNAKLKNAEIYPNQPFYLADSKEATLYDYAMVVGKGRDVKRDNPKLIELQQKWDDIISSTTAK